MSDTPQIFFEKYIMSDKNKYGKKGEDLTEKYLKNLGFIIYKRNYHSRYGEIDIIAEYGQLLTFVEVKTRVDGALVSPSEAVTYSKKEKIKKTARNFLHSIEGEYTVRFDVAEVTVFENEDGKPKFMLNYIKDAFM